MQLVYGTEFEHHVVSGSSLDECMDKVRQQYVEYAREELRQLRSELVEYFDAQEFGDYDAKTVIEEIKELINERLSAIQKVRDTEKLPALEKVLDKYFEEGHFIRRVS